MKKAIQIIVYGLLVSTLSSLNLSGQFEILNLKQLIITACIPLGDECANLDDLILRDICFVDRDTGFAVGGQIIMHGTWGTVLKTTDSGLTWDTCFTSELSCPVKCTFINNLTGFIAGMGGGGCCTYPTLYSTYNSGFEWNFITPITIIENRPTETIDIIFFNDSIGFVLHDNLYSLTFDGGDSWKTRSFCSSSKISSVYFFDNRTGWAVTKNGSILRYLEADWNLLHSSITSLALNKVFFIDHLNGWIAGGYSSNFIPIFFKTEDGGQTWQETENQDYLINDFIFCDSKHGYAAGRDREGYGVLMETADGGYNWEIKLDSLPGSLCALDIKDGSLWAAGGNDLVIKSIDTAYSGCETDPPLVSGINRQYIENNNAYLLNVPNPFQSSTLISYKLQVASQIQVNIYDFTGKKIATLVNETHTSGSHEVQWNATGFKPGIYFCELKTANSRTVQKVVLLK